MEYFGTGLYAIFAVLILWFMQRARGHSLRALIDSTGDGHHQIHAVVQKHPRGGSWQQHKQWLLNETKTTGVPHV